MREIKRQSVNGMDYNLMLIIELHFSNHLRLITYMSIKFNGFCTYEMMMTYSYGSCVCFLKLLKQSSFHKRWQLDIYSLNVPVLKAGSSKLRCWQHHDPLKAPGDGLSLALANF